jgi:hypothetical protein
MSSSNTVSPRGIETLRATVAGAGCSRLSVSPRRMLRT